jgi:hypothetical protein
MAKVRQVFEDHRIGNVRDAIAQEFSRPHIGETMRAGMTVAIAVGSRGLDNLSLIVQEIVSQIRHRGATPFVFPAMGSHAGATAEGQRALLESMGVTEAMTGAQIRSSMETAILGQTPKGQDVHIDRLATEADGIIVLGRVKPHTCFHGDHESGLLKMMAVGMGKQRGADICHAEGFGKMSENVLAVGRAVLAKARVLFGVAVLENAFDATFRIEAVPKTDIEQRERELLNEAKHLMPSILIPKFDVLIVDKIGKNYSGDGADPNITGTYCTSFASGGPVFERYVILDLSEETHSNAHGVGMADVTTKRVYDKTDFDEGYPNALTSRVLQPAKMPMVMASDRLAIQAALFTCVEHNPKAPKIVRLANTSHIDTIELSEALLPEASAHPRLQILSKPREMDFEASGNLW